MQRITLHWSTILTTDISHVPVVISRVNDMIIEHKEIKMCSNLP